MGPPMCAARRPLTPSPPRGYAYLVRIAILGAPRAGKTTLALEIGGLLTVEYGRTFTVWHADDFLPLGWSAASNEVRRILTSADDDFVLEGVAVVRGLRKALLALPEAPVDRCIVLERPRLALTRGQAAMARGCATILAEIEPELRRRGLVLERPA